MIYVQILILVTLLGGGFSVINECGLKGKIACNHGDRYRSISGSCNNLQHPNWGTAYSTYDRLYSPKYGCNDSMTAAMSGRPLPNARILSQNIFTDDTMEDKEVTLNAMQYGQLVTHDLSFNFLEGSFAKCCSSDFKWLMNLPDDCISIRVPSNDAHFSNINITCIPLIRTTTNRGLKCSDFLGYSEQISATNAYLDLSIIYGSNEEVHRTLRTFVDGLLVADNRKGNEWLPHSKDNLYCQLANKNERCYSTGDERVNQNPQLTILHIIWMREHNRIARVLKELNPHWDDERLFQEARRIAIAEHQHMTYYEMLPLYLGKQNMIWNGIAYEADGFVNDYDENMRPNVLNEHAQAAFRHYHSMVAGNLQLVGEDGCPYRSVNLRDTLLAPHLIEERDNYDSLIRGMNTQPAKAPGTAVDPEMTTYAFLLPYKYGSDMRAIDIQKARSHGLASYNDIRYICGLGRAKHFSDFLDVMDTSRVELLQQHYECPDDVDLVVGGSMERRVNGTLAGPTFLCIMNKQFYRTRRSDRFWYENENCGFNLQQLRQIRMASISKLLCDNGNYITQMQKDGFLQVSGRNPRLPCKVLPGPDLKFWKEHPTKYYSHWH